MEHYRVDFDLDSNGRKKYFLVDGRGKVYKTSEQLQTSIFEEFELKRRNTLIKNEDFELKAFTFEGKEIDYAVFPTDYVLCVAKDEKNSPPQITWNAVLAWMYENFDLSDGREWDRLKTKIETYFEPPKKKEYELEKKS